MLKSEDYPKLQKQLFGVVTAQKPEEYAKRAELTYKDGRVQVVIEVQDAEWVEDLTWGVEALGGQVETKVEKLIQASVPVEALLKLARHPRVVFIRPPARPQP